VFPGSIRKWGGEIISVVAHTVLCWISSLAIATVYVLHQLLIMADATHLSLDIIFFPEN